MKALCVAFLLLASTPAFAGAEARQEAFQRAMILLEQGQAEAAITPLQQLYGETREPRVRLELARAFLFAGDLAQAKALFIAAYEDNPPPGVRVTIQTFLDQIRKQEGKFTFGVSAARIQNPVQLPSQFSFTVAGIELRPQDSPEKKNVYGAIYSAGFEKKFGEGLDLRLFGAFRDMTQSFADYANVDASVGKQFAFFPLEARLGAQSFTMKGQSYTMPYVELATHKEITPSLSLNPRFQLGYFKSANSEGLSGGSYRAAMPLQLTLAPNQIVSLGVKAERRAAHFVEQSYWSAGPYAELFMGFDYASVNVSAQMTKTRFDALDPFWGAVRDDRALYAAIDIGMDALRFKGFVPSMGVYCSRNLSNLSYYKSRDCGVMTNLRKIY